MSSNLIFHPANGLAAFIEHRSKNKHGKVVLLADHVLRDTVFGTEIRIPEGFRSDLATVPCLLRAIYPELGAWARAALYHDYIFRVQMADKLYADQLFWRILRHDRVWYPNQLIFYYGVRIGGQRAWDNNTKLISSTLREIELNKTRNRNLLWQTEP